MLERTDRVSRAFLSGWLVVFVTLMAAPGLCLAQSTTGDPTDPAAVQPIAAPPTAAAGMPATPDDRPKGGLLKHSVQFVTDKFATTSGDKRGWYLELSNIITGAGWISVGPGYRKHFLDDKVFADVSAATSWHLYKMVQGRVEARDVTTHHLTLGAQTMWQDNTQVRYFGIGQDSLEDHESMYRMQSTDVVGYGSFRPLSSLTIGGEFGWLHSPDLSSPAGTFKPNLPATVDQFPLDPGVTPTNQPSYLRGELSATSDTRDYPGHPTVGGVYRVAMTSFQDQRADTFSFRQYQAEGAHFAQLTGPKWVLAIHGWFVSSDVPGGNDVPFYLLPSLGGADTLRGFSTYRFHDRSVAVVNGESRWTVQRNIDVAVFADAGNIAPRVGHLNLDKTSVGAGVRFHANHATFARFDVAHGAEGWHMFFRTTDPFRFVRIRRRVAELPFVP